MKRRRTWFDWSRLSKTRMWDKRQGPETRVPFKSMWVDRQSPVGRRLSCPISMPSGGHRLDEASATGNQHRSLTGNPLLLVDSLTIHHPMPLTHNVMRISIPLTGKTILPCRLAQRYCPLNWIASVLANFLNRSTVQGFHGFHSIFQTKFLFPPQPIQVGSAARYINKIRK